LAYRTFFDTIGDKTMARQQIQVTLGVRFFRTARGHEPVREWLNALGRVERRAIGEEIKTVQLGWPLGMPLVRKRAKDLWEIRVTVPGRSARVLFTVVGDTMVLLHGFFKQSRATPSDDLDVTVARLKTLTRAI
jgi:phage-related protein